jgi:hypothetical protein
MVLSSLTFVALLATDAVLVIVRQFQDRNDSRDHSARRADRIDRAGE